MFWGLINPEKERSGYVYKPVEIDVYVQVKAINDINLNEEYMDASIIITMEWYDPQLSWKTGKSSTSSGDGMNYTTISSIRADKNQVWVPEIEVLNRVNDFSPTDEKQRQLKIESSGKVVYSRAYRMRSMLSSSLNSYPYDTQFANIILSSADYSSEKVKLTVHQWVEGAGHNSSVCVLLISRV